VKLPCAQQAIIDPAKVRDYLLSETHPVGRFKAPFFRSLGYAVDRWEELGHALHKLAVDGMAESTESNQYGQKYRVVGTLRGPSEREARVVTIWIVLRGEEVPRFITAYPG